VHPSTLARRQPADDSEAPGKPTIRSARPELLNATSPRSTRRALAAIRRYLPRAVFFFGFGLLVLPVPPGAASFIARLGDAGPLIPWLDVGRPARAVGDSDRPLEPPGDRNKSASPACQSTEPSASRAETAIVNG
jgi:hypothetical protein